MRALPIETPVLEAADLFARHGAVVQRVMRESLTARRLAKVAAVLGKDQRFLSLDPAQAAQAWAISRRKTGQGQTTPSQTPTPSAGREAEAPDGRSFPVFMIERGSSAGSPHPSAQACLACRDVGQEGRCPGCETWEVA